MKVQDKSYPLKISQFDFIVTPVQIHFNKTQAQSYALELCKGAQVFNKFGQVIWVHAEQTTYKFVNNQSVSIKLNTDRNLECQWSIYKFTDDEMKEYFASITIDLSKEYKTVLETFGKYSKIGTIMQNFYQGKSTQYDWNIFRMSNSTVSNQKASNISGISIKYTVEIKHQLDHLAEQEHKMKMFKTHSKSSSSKLLQEGSKSFLEEQSVIKPQPQAPIISVHSPVWKRTEALSDIVEASNQCSTLNHQVKGHKVHPHIEQIPEQRQDVSPTLPSAKTHDFSKLDTNLDGINKKRSNTLRQNSDNFLFQEKKSDFQMKTAAQSHMSEPEKIVHNIPKKNSIIPKIIAFLIIITALSALYYFDYHGIKSQGVISFLKNISTKSKVTVKRKGKIISEVKKGKAVKYYEEQEQQYIPTINKKKGKSLEFNNKRRGITNKNKHQKKVDLLKLITSWIFSEESSQESSLTTSTVNNKKKNNQKSQGSWLSFGSSKDSSKKNKKGKVQSGSSWLSSFSWNSKKKNGQKNSESWLSSISSWISKKQNDKDKQKKKKGSNQDQGSLLSWFSSSSKDKDMRKSSKRGRDSQGDSWISGSWSSSWRGGSDSSSKSKGTGGFVDGVSSKSKGSISSSSSYSSSSSSSSSFSSSKKSSGSLGGGYSSKPRARVGRR